MTNIILFALASATLSGATWFAFSKRWKAFKPPAVSLLIGVAAAVVFAGFSRGPQAVAEANALIIGWRSPAPQSTDVSTNLSEQPNGDNAAEDPSAEIADSLGEPTEPRRDASQIALGRIPERPRIVEPEQYRSSPLTRPFLPEPYREIPVALSDWLQTRGTWLYYRWGLFVKDQVYVGCEDIKAVGEFGWSWESGYGVVCFDYEWLGIDVGEIARRSGEVGRCVRNINILIGPLRDGDPPQWGMHGASHHAVDLHTTSFLSFRVVNKGGHEYIETCR